MTSLSHVVSGVRNTVRRAIQTYGPGHLKRALWNYEFSRGHWNQLYATVGDFVCRYIERYAAQGSILDLGCGSGSTAVDPTLTYRDYTGVDISDVAIHAAVQRLKGSDRAGRARFVEADIVQYEPTRLHDVILFRDSLYYIPPSLIGELLQRYSAALAPGGVFIVRLYGESSKYKRILDVIGRSAHVIDTALSHDPVATVVVFRYSALPHSEDPTREENSLEEPLVLLRARTTHDLY